VGELVLPAIRGAAGTTVLAGLGLVDGKRSSLKFGAIYALNRLLRGIGVRHLDEAESARTHGLTIGNNLSAFDVPVGRKGIAQVVVAGVKTEVSDENSHIVLL